MEKEIMRLMSQFALLFVAAIVLEKAFPKFVAPVPASSSGPAQAYTMDWDSYSAV
jgi:hypothetical protein